MPEDRKRRNLDLDKHVLTRQEPDGSWSGLFPLLDIHVKAETIEGIGVQLVSEINERCQQSPEYETRWNAFFDKHSVEVEGPSLNEILQASELAAADFLELDDETFQPAVSTHSSLVVDFWAPWCTPCLLLTPVLKQVAEELGSSLSVGRVNLDDNPALWTRFDIEAIPTLILYADGDEQVRLVGAELSAAEIVQAIRPHISSG